MKTLLNAFVVVLLLLISAAGFVPYAASSVLAFIHNKFVQAADYFGLPTSDSLDKIYGTIYDTYKKVVG